MLKTRVIPVLLLKNDGLVKTRRFKNAKYVGDPINAVKIFNEKQVDELIFLDIMASKLGSKPNFDLIENIASECFIPFAYGGGITSLDDASRLFKLGVEKIVLNSACFSNMKLIREIAAKFGSQSVVVSIDVKRTIFNKAKVYSHSKNKVTKWSPVEFAKILESEGAGEIFVNSVDRDGILCGYDIPLLKQISETVSIPVIASGGAGNINDFVVAVKDAKVSAVAAGSLFVFYNSDRAVLINYPEYDILQNLLNK